MQTDQIQPAPSKHMSKTTLNLALWIKQLVEKMLMVIVNLMTRTSKNTLPHNVNIPTATYSPWKADRDFQAVLPEITEHSLVDIYRLYENWQLVEQLKTITGDIIEVGVWKGGSGCLMAHRAQLEKIDATVYLCDTFHGVVKAGGKDNKYLGGEFSDTSEEIVQNLVNSIGLQNTKILKGIFPDDNGDDLKDRSFRLCHIDVDTYDSAKDIVEWVWPRLSVGGAIVFDDYGFVRCEGVTKLVNELSKDRDKLFIHNLNGHGLIFKRD